MVKLFGIKAGIARLSCHRGELTSRGPVQGISDRGLPTSLGGNKYIYRYHV